MEGKKHITIRVSDKVKRVYKQVNYTKSPLIKAFRKKFKNSYHVFIPYFEKIKDVPPSLVGGKHTLSAPVNVKDKKEFEAFIGFIIYALKQSRGSVDKAIKYIRRELGV